jgi:hypothetical protein
MAFPALLIAFALGLSWVIYSLAPRGWTSWILAAGLAVAVGTGATSFSYFLLTWIGPARVPFILALDLLLFVPIAWLVWARGLAGASPGPDSNGRPNLILGAAAIAALAIVLPAIVASADVLPHGGWDAWSMWNVRARYLAGEGDQWRNAISADLIRSHPDYPLLLPATVARAWRFAGAMDPDVPRLLGLVFFVAVPMVLFGALSRLANANSGFLGLLVLAASAGYLQQAPDQYADIPLSLFILGAIACALLGQLELGGMLASCAAFTKNEGMVFALAYVAILRSLPALRGAIPGLATVAAFKIFLAPPAGFAGGGIHWDYLLPSIVALATEVYDYGPGIAHPVLLVAVLAAGLGLAPRAPSLWLRCLAILGVQFLGYLAAYLFTKNDLAFMLGGSTARVIGHLWPALILLAILRLAPFGGHPSASTTPAGTEDHREGASSGGRGKARRK